MRLVSHPSSDPGSDNDDGGELAHLGAVHCGTSSSAQLEVLWPSLRNGIGCPATMQQAGTAAHQLPPWRRSEGKAGAFDWLKNPGHEATAITWDAPTCKDFVEWTKECGVAGTQPGVTAESVLAAFWPTCKEGQEPKGCAFHDVIAGGIESTRRDRTIPNAIWALYHETRAWQIQGEHGDVYIAGQRVAREVLGKCTRMKASPGQAASVDMMGTCGDNPIEGFEEFNFATSPAVQIAQDVLGLERDENLWGPREHAFVAGFLRIAGELGDVVAEECGLAWRGKLTCSVWMQVCARSRCHGSTQRKRS